MPQRPDRGSGHGGAGEPDGAPIPDGNETSDAAGPGPPADALQPLLARIAPGSDVENTISLGGRNSLVLRLELSCGRRLVAKRYARRGPDRLDPLEIERRALRFLVEHGLERVPRHLGSDVETRWAVLSEVPGLPAGAETIGERDIGSLLEFLAQLDRLGEAPAAATLPPASEASFSLVELRRDVARRFPRLHAHAGEDPVAREMRSWLDEKLEPAFRLFDGEAEARLNRAGVGPGDLLAPELRRLSPSDLGFHNMLRDEDGRWSFVDFEYFGWDDPAKTLCDLLLHPRANVPVSLRRLVVERRLRALGGDAHLRHRLRAYFPLFAVKWCLILLNEFAPRDLERRLEAGLDTAVDPRPRQLERARRRLRDVTAERLPDVLA